MTNDERHAEKVRRQIAVPLWMWTAFFTWELAASRSWLEAAGNAGLVAVGFAVAHIDGEDAT